MQYRYETHCHCSQCSGCGRSTSQEMVQAYHKAGYAGLVLTDHFVLGNTAVDTTLPWEQQMHCYYNAYLDAKAAAEELDFDVIFGIEHAYGDGKEVLIYGIGLDFLLANPDIPKIPLDEFVRRVQKAGGIVIQAHPYRNRPYVNMDVAPRTDIVDGIEVHNICNNPGADRQALALTQEKDFLITSGGDMHWAQDPRLGQSGIVLPYRIRDEKELVAALKRGDQQYIVNGRIVPQILEEHLT